ncbi:MAG: hypothetical protein KME15_06545 [Drouetiella hepatica Uher 2000/2452]|uniref:Uncharacterized protein n=1 Tax=Drouetiella hepatica Uher 2000/2452 TaxID=904376 RepID=A0A951QAL5_9CYAN|nr:hypothetical protein [Drouetiella hepatica Uher 2000/2452]
MSYSKLIIGAAIFDISGLPKEYLTSTESSDVSWVQTIFQALGLQSLLTSSIKLEGFRHVIVHAKDYRAIVVKQKVCYTALLCQSETQISAELIQWAMEFQPTTLKNDPRFSVV